MVSIASILELAAYRRPLAVIRSSAASRTGVVTWRLRCRVAHQIDVELINHCQIRRLLVTI